MEMRPINILKTTKATKFFKITLERTYKVVLGVPKTTCFRYRFGDPSAVRLFVKGC